MRSRVSTSRRCLNSLVFSTIAVCLLHNVEFVCGVGIHSQVADPRHRLQNHNGPQSKHRVPPKPHTEWKSALLHTIDKGSNGNTKIAPVPKVPTIRTETSDVGKLDAGTTNSRKSPRRPSQLDFDFLANVGFAKPSPSEDVVDLLSDSPRIDAGRDAHAPTDESDDARDEQIAPDKTPHVLRENAIESDNANFSQSITVIVIMVTVSTVVLAAVAYVISVCCSSAPCHRGWSTSVDGDFLHARQPDATPVSILKRTPRALRRSLRSRANNFWWSPLPSAGPHSKAKKREEDTVFYSNTPGGTIRSNNAVSIV